MSKNIAKQKPEAHILQTSAAATEELNRLLPLAREDAESCEQFLKLTDKEGTTAGLVKVFDIAKQAGYSLAKSFGEGDVLARKMAERRIEELAREVAGPNPTPLETLLAERVALCWFHVHLVECTVAQRHEGLTIPVAEYQQKRLDKAHKRYLAAIKTMAQVRKLQLPTVQVNIGEKQVNVANVGQIIG